MHLRDSFRKVAIGVPRSSFGGEHLRQREDVLWPVNDNFAILPPQCSQNSRSSNTISRFFTSYTIMELWGYRRTSHSFTQTVSRFLSRIHVLESRSILRRHENRQSRARAPLGLPLPGVSYQSLQRVGADQMEASKRANPVRAPAFHHLRFSLFYKGAFLGNDHSSPFISRAVFSY